MNQGFFYLNLLNPLAPYRGKLYPLSISPYRGLGSSTSSYKSLRFNNQYESMINIADHPSETTMSLQ